MAEQGEKTWFQRFKEGMQFFLIVFGACWGIYTFVYKDIIVPTRRPPAVTLAAQLEELDRADGMILARAHLVVVNRGDAKVWVPALWWHVYGVGLSGEERTTGEFATVARPWLEDRLESMSRFSTSTRVEVVAVGRIAEHNYWYQPRDETVHEQLFLVPEGRFDVLQIVVDAYITKGISQLAPTRWTISDQGELSPTLMLKQKGWDQEHPSRVEPFTPDLNRTHRLLSDRDDTGHNSTTASLRIKPKGAKAGDGAGKR